MNISLIVNPQNGGLMFKMEIILLKLLLEIQVTAQDIPLKFKFYFIFTLKLILS